MFFPTRSFKAGRLHLAETKTPPTVAPSSVGIYFFHDSTCTGPSFNLGATEDGTEGGSGNYEVTTDLSDPIFTVGIYCAYSHSYGSSLESSNVLFTIIAPVPQSTPAPVGGVVIPANNLAIAAPWLALIGVVGCIGTVVVMSNRWKRPEN